MNQLFGLVVFFVLSAGVSKQLFGQLSWSLALLMISFSILSAGIDQLMVKKIAAGEDARQLLSHYLVHVFITGVIFYGFLLISYLSFPASISVVLIWVAIGKVLVYFSLPFKQLATGMGRLGALKKMSIVSNGVKAIGLIAFYFLDQLSLSFILLVFVVADAAELIVSFLVGRHLIQGKLFSLFHFKTYGSLVRHSLPQLGVVVFAAAISRFDWLYIGWYSSADKLAEYSFAYKVFEMSTLPLLIIAPVLVPMFVKLQGNKISSEKADLHLMIRIQMIIATFTVLILNVGWNPAIDLLTGHKYGTVNTVTIFFLSLCIPFLYLNNFLWSEQFAAGKLKAILKLFALSFGVNVLAVSVLVPLYGNEGAALSFFLTVVMQSAGYLRMTAIGRLQFIVRPLLISFAIAFSSGWLAKFFLFNPWLLLPVAIALFLLVLALTRYFTGNDLQRIRKVLAW